MEASVVKRSQINRRMYPVQKILRFFSVLLLEAGILWTLFWICLRPLKISGKSMEPVLSEGSIVLVNRVYRYMENLRRGDMIVFQDGNGTFVKRIIGLPGENVEVIEGQVFINSCPVEEAYANHLLGDAAQRSDDIQTEWSCVYDLDHFVLYIYNDCDRNTVYTITPEVFK